MIVTIRGNQFDIGTPSGDHYMVAHGVRYVAVPCDAVKMPASASIHLSDEILMRHANAMRHGQPRPPIHVRARGDGTYGLLDGTHRWALSVAAGYPCVPVRYDGMSQ